ncbi:uncharacterized protein LOC128222532 isoform X2 [Mya arenaria]|nr:uncharacterized protein LOC128222532 isoform X2 [Mya arenaria]
MPAIHYSLVIAVVAHFSNADITSLEEKVNLISSMQTFVLQDMMLIKGKLANTDMKLDQLFDRIDKLQSTEHVRGFTEGDIEQISAKVVQQVSERVNLQQIGNTLSGVSKETAAKLEVLENKVNENYNAVNGLGADMTTVSHTLTRVKRGFAKEKLSLVNEVSELKETTTNVKKAIDDIFVDFNNTMDIMEHKHTEITTKLKTDIETMVTQASVNIAEIVKNESLKATRLIQDTLNYFGNNMEKLSSSIAFVVVNISSELDNRESEVINRLDNISSECVKLTGHLNNHDEKMMFIHIFDGIGIKDFQVPGARARLANATKYDTNGVQGRLEVNVNGEWGTVCDSNFNTKDNSAADTEEETVACRTLNAGFAKGLALPFTPFGQSIGRVVFKKNCAGDEHSIFECSDEGDPITCGRERDVHLRCFK